MLERMNEVFEIWNSINKELSLRKACFIFKGRCIFIFILFLIIVFYFNNLHIGIFIFAIIIGIIFADLMKKFREKIIKEKKIESLNHFQNYWLDIKYFLLKKEINNRDYLNKSLNDIVKNIKNLNSITNISLVEKNPVFVVSFAILLAILSSGNLNNGKDLYILAFFFILSIIGIFISFQIHPLFSFNKDKQLLFLLEILVKENEHQNDQLGGE